jgi:WD40 repeat protein
MTRMLAAKDGTELCRFGEYSDAPSVLAFTPDGKMLLGANGVGKVRLWDVASGKEIRRLGKYSGSVTSLSLSPDGKTVVVSVFSEGALRLCDVANGNEVFLHGRDYDFVSAATLTPDGKIVAVALSPGRIMTWDVKSNQRRWIHTKTEEYLGDVRFSPDGRTLAVGAGGTAGGTVTLYDVDTGGLVQSWNAQRTGGLNCVAFSPDGFSLACADLSKMVSIMDVKTGKARLRFSTTDRCVSAVAFAPGGRLLATASKGGLLGVWDAANGASRRTFPEYAEGTGAFAYSPTGMMIACSGTRGPILLLEAASGKHRACLEGAGQSVTDLAFGPDGATLAAGNSEGSIRLVDLTDGTEWRSLNGHRGAVDRLDFSSDGRLLLSTSQDGTALIWDLATIHKTRPAPALKPLSPEALKSLWSDLAGEDAVKAFRAVLALASAKESAAFIKEQLAQVTPSYRRRQEYLKQIIGTLNSGQIKAREKALAELKQFPEESEPWLRRVLTSNESVELKEEIEELLESTQGSSPLSETLCILRAVETLEIMGTRNARVGLVLAQAHPRSSISSLLLLGTPSLPLSERRYDFSWLDELRTREANSAYATILSRPLSTFLEVTCCSACPEPHFQNKRGRGVHFPQLPRQ